MESFGSGPEAAAFYHEENNYEDPGNVEVASKAVEMLLDEENVNPEDGVGIFFSTGDMREGVASELHETVMDNGYPSMNFHTDQTAYSDIVNIHTASGMHNSMTREEDQDSYSIAVTAGSNPDESVATAYLIGRNPFLQISQEKGLAGTYSEINDETNTRSEELNYMKQALDGFIDAATTERIPVGSSEVVMNNSSLVHPMENIVSAFFSLGEFDDNEVASAYGFGRLARQAKGYELGFESDPEVRNDEDYLNNIMEMDDFEEFYQNAVKPALTLRNELGELDNADLSASRVSALQDAKENGKTGLMMTGSFSTGGRTAEVIAEEIVDEPVIHMETDINLS